MQPSRHEGKPIAVEEAKILCKPILVTNYTSAHEQLENGKFGEIADISEDSGFGSIRSFNRAFIKNIGITPADYRKTQMR